MKRLPILASRVPTKDRVSPESRISGFTFTELLVVVALGTVLVGTILPTLNTTSDTAKAAACLANMHEWGLAISLYCEDWNDYIPPEGSGSPASCCPYAWYNVVPPYIGAKSLIVLYANNQGPTARTKSIYSCPSDLNCPDHPTDANPYYMYGMNGRMDPNGSGLFKRSQSVKPSETIMFCENEGTFSATNGKYCPARHNGGGNFTFVDGHANWLQFQDYCRAGNPGCTSTLIENDSSSAGDWKTGVKYHWFPYKYAST